MICPKKHRRSTIYLHVVPNDNIPDGNSHKVAIILDCATCNKNGSWLYTFSDRDDLFGIGKDVSREWRKWCSEIKTKSKPKKKKK